MGNNLVSLSGRKEGNILFGNRSTGLVTVWHFSEHSSEQLAVDQLVYTRAELLFLDIH